MATAVIVILLALAVGDGIRQTHWKSIHNPNDFVTLWAGSICMTHACNPYSIPDLDDLLVAARGTEIRQDWSDQLPIYPPTTLILLLPFSLLSYRSAMLLWYALSLATYTGGLCWLYFVSPQRHHSRLVTRALIVLLGLHFPKMMQCLGFGNPSLIVTGLLLFLNFDESESRSTVRFVAAGVACLLKPPLALPLAALMFLRSSGRTTFPWRTATAAALLLVAMGVFAYIPPGMAHWRADLTGNIAIGEHAGMSPSLRGEASNAMLNVANLPGYFTYDPVTVRLISWSVIAVLSAIFLFLLSKLRGSSEWEGEGYLAAAAALAALTLLPVYHRFCDIGVLLVAVPWVLYSLARRPRWQTWASATLLLLLYFSWERRIHLDRLTGGVRSVVEFLYYRGDACLVLVLTCVLLSAMWSCSRFADGDGRAIGIS